MLNSAPLPVPAAPVNHAALQTEVAHYLRLREELKTSFADLDDETLADTLEGATSLHELIAEVLRSALLDEALAAGLKARIEDMKARLERFTMRAAKKRQIVLAAMVAADLRKISAPDLTASLRQGGPTLDVLEPERIPAVYWKPQEPKLDRLSLLAALKNGAVVEGATLTGPQPQLSVRSK